MTRISSPGARQPWVVVNAYAHIDTGGPEALVQLAVALSGLFNSTRLLKSPLNPRLAAEYPALPQIPQVGWNHMRPGDLLVQPDTTPCNEAETQRGVSTWIWMLSTAARRQMWRNKRRGCHALAHNFWLASHTLAGFDLARRWVIRPYISPTIRASCAVARGGAQKRNLVLLDSDTTDEVAAAARGACGNSSEVCEVVLVKGLPRAEVGRLLAAARIVVDWCLIGTERMVVEAVLCGAVLLTSHCLCGTEPRDFPIPERNLLATRRPGDLRRAIPRVLGDFERETAEYAGMRELYGSLDADSFRAETLAAFAEELDARDGGARAAALPQREVRDALGRLPYLNVSRT